MIPAAVVVFVMSLLGNLVLGRAMTACQSILVQATSPNTCGFAIEAGYAIKAGYIVAAVLFIGGCIGLAARSRHE